MDPVPSELNKFLPCELDDVKDVNLFIQVTHFDCGGMAIGICISHKVADGPSCFAFVHTWAAIARGETNVPSPIFGSASLFPQKDELVDYKANTRIFVEDEAITKRFVFDASQIAALRDRFAENSTQLQLPRRPSRIETLSAFIWSRFVAATGGGGGGAHPAKKIHVVVNAVNMRTRADPPLPEYYFGNMIWMAVAIPSINVESDDICIEDQLARDVLSKLGEAISNINGDYVKKLWEGDQDFMLEQTEKFTNGTELAPFFFSSFCRFPLYEADFGWGRPSWVASASLKSKNVVVFMDTPSGDGIEAWVNLKKEDMAKFEIDQDLHAFVSPIMAN